MKENGSNTMTPFDKYMAEAKEIRAKYKELIDKDPAHKDILTKEMQDILAKRLDECEKEEQDIFKKKDNYAI